MYIVYDQTRQRHKNGSLRSVCLPGVYLLFMLGTKWLCIYSHSQHLAQMWEVQKVTQLLSNFITNRWRTRIMLQDLRKHVWKLVDALQLDASVGLFKMSCLPLILLSNCLFVCIFFMTYCIPVFILDSGSTQNMSEASTCQRQIWISLQ